MISPVTSTNVATKGAEEVAGSTLKRFRTIGIIEPISVPHITIPISEKKIVIAIKSQWGPYSYQ